MSQTAKLALFALVAAGTAGWQTAVRAAWGCLDSLDKDLIEIISSP